MSFNEFNSYFHLRNINFMLRIVSVCLWWCMKTNGMRWNKSSPWHVFIISNNSSLFFIVSRFETMQLELNMTNYSPSPASVSNAFIWKINENVWHSHLLHSRSITLQLHHMMYNMAHESLTNRNLIAPFFVVLVSFRFYALLPCHTLSLSSYYSVFGQSKCDEHIHSTWIQEMSARYNTYFEPLLLRPPAFDFTFCGH